MVNVRLRVIGRLYRGEKERKAPTPKSSPRVASTGKRKVAFGPAKSDRVEVPVFARSALLPHVRFTGPAIIEQSDSTLLVTPARNVSVDAYANLLIEAAP